MTKYLTIRADTNDADYVTEETEIEGWVEENLETILKVGREVMRFSKENPYKHNWEDINHSGVCLAQYKDVLEEEELEVFREVCPCGDYGIHTIESIEVREITVLEKLTK